MRKDLNRLSNERKLDDSESFDKKIFAKRTEYRSLMREHLKIERETEISELCFASDVDEKMFWKLIKVKRCSSQLGSFMVDGRLTNSPQEIIEMWFNHFRILGSFGQDISFDENFRLHVVTSVLHELSSDLNHVKTCSPSINRLNCQKLYRFVKI